MNISFNGPDNVGKTTQIRLLTTWFPETFVAAPGVHNFGTGWPKHLNAEETKHWWFRDCPTLELTAVIMRAYVTRRTQYASLNQHVLLDRGLDNLEAVCIATAMVKDSVTFDEAYRSVNKIKDDIVGDEQGEQIRLFINFDEDPYRSAEMSLRREIQHDEVYRQYQLTLHETLEKMRLRRNFDAVLYCAQRSAIEVQNEIRQWLTQLGLPLDPACQQLRRLLAIAGMSESGKSTAGEYLRLRHQVTRLKIGYLLEQAARIRGISDIYALPEEEQAEMLIAELDRFSKSHYYLQTFSIESLRSYRMAIQFKRMLNDRLVIVYLDASPESRALRTTETLDSLLWRDHEKAEKGAAFIKTISDYVVDNTKSRFDLARQLEWIVSGEIRSSFIPQISDLTSMPMPARYRKAAQRVLDLLHQKAGKHLVMYMVTGSAADGRVIEGWSDLDLLAVLGPATLSAVRRPLSSLLKAQPIKVGLTILTPGEVAHLTVDSKVAHILHQLSQGARAVQYMAEGYQLPVVGAMTRSERGFEHLGTVIHLIRRELLTPLSDTKALLKLVALSCKVLLRSMGQDCPDSDKEAVTVARQVFSGMPAVSFSYTTPIPDTEEIKAINQVLDYLRWFEESVNTK